MELYACGPSGGSGGEPFSDQQALVDLGPSRVHSVRVQAAGWIDAIQIIHQRPDGELRNLPRHGGPGGAPYTLVLEDGEHLTAIHGAYADYVDWVRIDTDRRRVALRADGAGFATFLPPAGRYRYEAPAGMEIAGFAGRAGAFLDAIGVVLRPLAVRR